MISLAMLLAIISDTHLPLGQRRLPGACIELLKGADHILHAGDISTVSVLSELENLGPTLTAVLGNVDEPALSARLACEVRLEFQGVKLAMIHDAGPASGRLARLGKRFPDVAGVIFGHSHIPLLQGDKDFQIFNPGSPTDRRRQPEHSMGLARIDRGAIVFEHIPLPA